MPLLGQEGEVGCRNTVQEQKEIVHVEVRSAPDEKLSAVLALPAAIAAAARELGWSTVKKRGERLVQGYLTTRFDRKVRQKTMTGVEELSAVAAVLLHAVTMTAHAGC